MMLALDGTYALYNDVGGAGAIRAGRPGLDACLSRRCPSPGY